MAACALLAVAAGAASGPPCSKTDARRVQVGFRTWSRIVSIGPEVDAGTDVDSELFTEGNAVTKSLR